MTSTEQNQTPTSVLRLLSRQPGALVAMIVLGLFIVLAFLAYLIAPDNTPNADRQMPELQAAAPGFSTLLIRVPLTDTSQPRTGNWFSGYPAYDQFIPVASYAWKNNQLVFQRLLAPGLSVPDSLPIQAFHSSDTSQVVSQRKFWLGTDKLGRDVWSRLLVGTRVSLSVGLAGVIISLLIGLSLGLLAGYYGGWLDAVIQWIVQVSWSIPTILLVFAITLALGKGYSQLLLAIGLTMWVSVARLVRGQVLTWKERPFVQAAQVLGYSDWRIITRHILPNLVGPLLVMSAANFAAAIMIEAGLSFLGAGVQPPQPSWGLMIKEHYAFIITSRPSLALIPGLAMMLMVLSWNLLANALRDALSTPRDL